MNDEGRPRGIAFITFKDEAAVEAALKFHETDYGGRTISVRKAGDRPKGKGKDGKGKDGKGKDKGKKGKGKGGMSFEQKAAKDGAMVESTGTKQTFADSDDDDAPPAKKAKKTADSDDEPAEPKKKKAKK